MRNVCKKFKIWGVLLLLILAATGFSAHKSQTEVEAAVKTGFRTYSGKTYYIDPDGSKHKGWLNLNGKKYYFNRKTGVQVKGFVFNDLNVSRQSYRYGYKGYVYRYSYKN